MNLDESIAKSHFIHFLKLWLNVFDAFLSHFYVFSIQLAPYKVSVEF